MEKAMAPHSSTLAWKIPWTEEPGGLQSVGSLSRTRLSDFTITFPFHALEKEMATNSNILASKIPWTEEPGRLPSMASLSKSALIVICVVHFSRVHPQSSSSLLSVTGVLPERPTHCCRAHSDW